jgi:N,N'-diacetylchitobiose transport system permease protein
MSAPKGRGAAWTEERGARDERRGTREGGALSALEAHRKQSPLLSARTARRTKTIGLNGIGLLVALITLFPIVWMVSTAFKPSQEIYSLTPRLLPAHPTLGNFSTVVSGRASGIGSVFMFFRNSLSVTLATVLIASLVSLLASVAVARFRFRFRASFLIMLLIVQMIPGQALIIALFVDFNKLNLLQNLAGLIIVYAAQALPVSIWMLRNFVATVPKELEEAAAIDGATPVRIFWRILFPLVAPGLVATSIFSFITAYNEFIVALTFLGQAHQTYTLPIYVTYFFGRGGAQWGPIMAASTLYTIPVVIFFLIVRRRLVNGLVAGAVKG